MRSPAAHAAHVRAHDDLLVRVATCGNSVEDFVDHCRGTYRPSVYADLSGTRLADVIDAEFARRKDPRRCWRGHAPQFGADLDQVDAWIESEVRRLAAVSITRRAA